jgi:pilus assembly protein CpaE
MRAILICPDETLRKQFEEAIAPYKRALVMSKVLNHYPAPEVFARLIRAWVPEVIFLSVEDLGKSEALNRQLDADFPAVQRIAIHSSQEPEVFRFALRSRMHELLVPPFDHNHLGETLALVAQHVALHPAVVTSTDRFYAFVPAKAGVGASTVAANATWALSEIPSASVLLADFDIYSGMTGFMFNVEHEFSISDAAARSRALDEDAWQKMVKKVGNIDLLLSDAPRVGENIQSSQASNLVEFARRNYSIVNADLPDTFDDASLAVLRDASRIFLVVTPELTALRMARMKALLFRKLDLEEKVFLVLNRVTKRMELSVAEIEKTVGLPVFASFPCAYADVVKGIRTGQPAAKLAGAARDFAEKLLDKQLKPEKRARFIERFAVVPLRYGFR